MEVQFLLSRALIAFFNSQDIWHLSQVRNCCGVVFSDDYWFTVVDLDLTGDLDKEFSCFILDLNAAGIRLSLATDSLVWSYNKINGKVTGNDAYFLITQHLCEPDCRWWLTHMWKRWIPLKIMCFLWLYLDNCITT